MLIADKTFVDGSHSAGRCRWSSFHLGQQLGCLFAGEKYAYKDFPAQSFLVSVFTPQFVHTTSRVWIAFDKWDAQLRNLLEQD